MADRQHAGEGHDSHAVAGYNTLSFISRKGKDENGKREDAGR